jgi:hypothetical protein
MLVSFASRLSESRLFVKRDYLARRARLIREKTARKRTPSRIVWMMNGRRVSLTE